jgi:hypothetical protein
VTSQSSQSLGEATSGHPRPVRDLSSPDLDLFAWARSGAAVTPRAALTGVPATQARRSSESAVPPRVQAPCACLGALAGDREAPSAGVCAGAEPPRLGGAAAPKLDTPKQLNGGRHAAPSQPVSYSLKGGAGRVLKDSQGDACGGGTGGADQREAPGPTATVVGGRERRWALLARWRDTTTAAELRALIEASRRLGPAFEEP